MARCTLTSLPMLIVVMTAACSNRPHIDTSPASNPPAVVSPIPAAGPQGQFVVDEYIIENLDDPDAGFSGYRTFLFDAESGSRQPLVEGHAPAWSPDGSQLAYISYSPSGKTQVFVLTAEGYLTQLLETSTEVEDLAWSPDGSQIAFVALHEDNCFLSNCPRRGSTFVASADGSQMLHLAEGQSPAWSPDGRQLAFVANRPDHLISVADMSDDQHPVTNLSNTWASQQALTWSPDGSRIAYITVVDDNPNSIGISVVDVASGQVINVTDSFDHDPTWSPDGALIAFTRGSAYLEIHVVEANGENPSQLTFGQDHAVSGFRPHWSADGARLTFISVSGADQTGGYARLCTLELKTGGTLCQVELESSAVMDSINAVWRPN